MSFAIIPLCIELETGLNYYNNLNMKITFVDTCFAALKAVRKLRKADASREIDLVSPEAEFVYYPGAIWMPTGLRKPEDLVINFTNFFKRMKVTFHAAEATGLSTDGRTLHTSIGIRA